MKRATALIALLFVCILPSGLHAHERQTFEVNGINYQFVVGSVGEPVFVDDKSGVELRVERVSVALGHEEHHHGVGPGAVEGLEKVLKVELRAGDKKKVLDLTAAYNEVGLYRAPFFPTASEQLTYRFYGVLEGTPIDVSFTCAEAGHVMESKAETSRVEIAPGIVRVSKAGSFSCPREKNALGFPHETVSIAQVDNNASSSGTIGYMAGAIGLFALGASLFRRRR